VSAPNHGGFAFPAPNSANANGQEGMTLRDWFAGKALEGELASSSTEMSCRATSEAATRAGRTVESHIALNCYKLADAMLAARNGKEPA